MGMRGTVLTMPQDISQGKKEACATGNAEVKTQNAELQKAVRT